jgi:hypothetical protein
LFLCFGNLELFFIQSKLFPPRSDKQFQITGAEFSKMSKLKNFFASPSGLIALYTAALVTLWLLIRFIAGSFNKIVEFFKNGKLKVDPFMNGVKYPVSYWTEKGGRPYQEDRFHVMKGGPEVGNTSLYGVFDGHGGYRAAQFCKEFLLQTIGTDPDLNTSPPLAIHRSFLKLATLPIFPCLALIIVHFLGWMGNFHLKPDNKRSLTELLL